MPISVDLEPLFYHTVTVCKRTSKHSSGYPTPGYQSTSNGRTFKAHIEDAEHFIRTEHGHETVGGWKVFLYSTTAFSQSTNFVKVVDKIVLPAGFEPRTPQIISASVVSDEWGPHHQVIKCRR
jgi:hypothetical protein